MSEKKAFDRQMVQLGIKIVHLGPLGPLSEKEWNKWLEYIPEFQQQRMSELSGKQVADLTDKEMEELRIYRKELKMRTISKNYGSKETSANDRMEYVDYSTQKNLDSLIRRKLTAEEYESSVARIQEIVDSLSYEELRQYCESANDSFDEISMVDLFVLREVSRVFLAKADEKSIKRLSYHLERNEVMRQRSMIEASKHIVF